MFQLKDTFRSYDKNRQPYTFHVERHTETENLHAGAVEGGFSLKSVGNRHILNTPDVVSGRWSMDFHINYMEVMDPEFVLFFGYDEIRRAGMGIRLHYHLNGGLEIGLVSVDKSLISEIEKKTYESVRWAENETISLELNVREQGVACAVSGICAEFECGKAAGRLAIERNSFIGELILENIRFETGDDLPVRNLLPSVTVDIPLVNGGDIPYSVRWQVDEIGGEVYLHASVFGGTKSRAVDKDSRRGQYVAEKDTMTSPYAGVCCAGVDQIFQMSLGENWLIDPNIYWECQKGFFGDTPLPMEGLFRLERFEAEAAELIFGYENLVCSGYRSQAGGHEFRYDRQGALTYSGAPLDGKDHWEIYSPFDKFALTLIPEDCWHRNEIVHHLKYNHYFETKEKISFRLELHTLLEPDYLTVQAELIDVFEKNVLDTAQAAVETGKWKKDYFCLKASASFGTLGVGVYKIRFRLFYGGKLYDTMTRVFEVFSKDTDENPALKTGLPFTFSMPNEQKWLMRNSFDLWNPAVSCDVEHFITCITDTPIEAEIRRPWEVIKPFKREWFAWLAKRTANDWLDERHAIVRKHADYLFYAMDDGTEDWGSECTLFPFRTDHWNYRHINNPYQKKLLRAFFSDRPEAAKETGYNPGDERMPYEVFEALMTKYGHEWMEYVNEDVVRLFRQQNAELEKENPGVRRTIYGPQNVYVTPTLTHHSARFYGLPTDERLTKDVFTGFMIYEDYPYSCAYQTYRGAFGMMTLALHYPGSRIYPEQYKGSPGGCIDGAVKYAHAPMGAYTMEAYQNSTHAFEFVFNTAHRRTDGYHYWDDYGFHRSDYVNEFMNRLIMDWRYAVENKPAKPLRSMAFVADYDAADDVFSGTTMENGKKYTLYNRCGSASGLLHECSREAGLPNGFALKRGTLSDLSANECDVLVIPGLKNADAQTIREIRRLYEAGVNLIGLFDVSGLEDLFGVVKSPAEEEIHTIEYRGQIEAVYSRTGRFEYASAGAEPVMTANGSRPAMLATSRTLLINTDVENLGSEEPRRVNGSNGYHMVGRLIRKALKERLVSLSSPLVRGDNVGVTLFESKAGKTMLLAIDYSAFDNAPKGEKEAVVRVSLPGVCNAKSDAELFVGRKNGEVKELRFPILPHGFVFVELERNG